MIVNGIPVTQQPDAPSAVELAQRASDAARGLIDVARPGGDPAVQHPAGLRRTLDELAILGHRLEQAVQQLTAVLHHQHHAGHLNVDPSTEHAGDLDRAVDAATVHLRTGEQLAEQLADALDRASRALTHVSCTGTDPAAAQQP